MKAPVNKIIPVSVVDGPGNRTAVFLQGCNISCAYCHNPETQKLCCSCGLCLADCPAGALSQAAGHVVWDDRLCVSCDQCISVCPHSASPRVKEMSAKAVFEEVIKNVPFIRGITVSGGECCLYPEFLQELFLYCQNAGLTCLLDSNGTVDFSLHPELLATCDGVMLDVKSWNPDIYRKLTGADDKGADNKIVLKNLKLLWDCNKLEEIRIVCLPGESDYESVLIGIVDLLGSPVENRIKLIKFRPFGVKGRLQDAAEPSDSMMNEFARKARDWGYRNLVIT